MASPHEAQVLDERAFTTAQAEIAAGEQEAREQADEDAVTRLLAHNAAYLEQRGAIRNADEPTEADIAAVVKLTESQLAHRLPDGSLADTETAHRFQRDNDRFIAWADRAVPGGRNNATADDLDRFRAGIQDKPRDGLDAGIQAVQAAMHKSARERVGTEHESPADRRAVEKSYPDMDAAMDWVAKHLGD